jgi:hypothetical protein
VLQRVLSTAPAPAAAPPRVARWRLRQGWPGRRDWRRPQGITSAPRPL